jgi:molybdate transport system ATP-binding protein
MVRLRLRARDVAVATVPPESVSIHNVLPCRLDGIDPSGATGEVFLRLDLGGTTVLSRVMREAVGRLGLVPGQRLYALVKSVTFDRAGAGGGMGGAP